MTLIKSVRDWLRLSGLLDVTTFFGINFLKDEPTAYTIEDVPGSPILSQYLSGAKRTKSYILATRDYYSSDVLDNASNSGFFDELIAWIETQSKLRNFPVFDGKQIQKINVTSSGYILDSTVDTARYQMQIEIIYYEKT